MLFLANVAPELFDEHNIGIVESFPVVTVVVEANSEAEASEAAASWFGDNSKTLMTGEDDYIHNKYGVTRAEPIGDAGHFVYLESKHIRYTCVRAIKATQEEVDFFFSVTCGLKNGVIKKK